MKQKERWSRFICERCQKRLFEKHPKANGCAFESFDGCGSCWPHRPYHLKGGTIKRAQVEADFNENGACSPDDARAVVRYFHDVLEAYGIDVHDFEKELNERHMRLYQVRKESTGKERIYIYFKDCFYLLVDDNMHELLIEKVEGGSNV